MRTPLPTYQPGPDVVADKVTWRGLVRAARRELVAGWGPEDRARAAAALGRAGVDYLTRYAEATGRGPVTGAGVDTGAGPVTGASLVAGMTVTAFEPMRTEPPVDGLTSALVAAGVRVLVPITLAKPSLDWADLTDPERTPMGEDVLAEVDLFFVPALAISRDGVRLGQGGGYYDSTLPRARELSGGAPVVVVLHDHEVVDAVPADGHDVVVDAVLRPSSGVVPITSISG